MKTKTNEFVSCMTQIMVFIPLLFFVTGCSLPTDPTPVKWNVSTNIPLVKESIALWEPLDSIIGELKSGGSGSTTLSKDSILTLVRHDTLRTSISLSTMFDTKPSKKVQTLGEIEIANMDPVAVPLSNLKSNPQSSLSIQFPLASNQFEQMHFTSKSKSATVSLQNTASATIVSGTLSVSTNGTTVQSAIPLISAGSSAAIPLNVAGTDLIPKITTISISLQYETPVASGAVGSILLSLNGATIDRGSILASLFPDSISMPLSVDLAESLLIESIRYDSLVLINSISNGLPFPVLMKTAIRSQKSGKLVPLLTTNSPIKSGSNSITSSLKSIELEPNWIDSTKKSVLDLAVTIYPAPTKGFVKYSAQDSLSLSVSFGKSKFAGISGIFVNGISDTVGTDEWELPELMAKDMRDSIAGKLKIVGSSISAKLLPTFSQGSQIDKMNLNLTTSYRWVDSPAKYLVEQYTFEKLKPLSPVTINTSGDTVMNSLPERVGTKSIISIPRNTHFSINSTDGSLSLPFMLFAEVKIPLHAKTGKEVSIITSVQEIEVPSDQLQVLKSIENAMVKLNLHYKNNSSVTMKIYGVGADKVNLKDLNEMNSSLLMPGVAPSFFFDLTGGQFIELKSGEETSASWTIGSEALRAFADNDRIGMRFHIQLPAGADLKIQDVSAIDIRSSIAITGTAHSSFLED